MTKSKKKKAFVILPITVPLELYNDLRHFHHVFEYLFKPALEKAGFNAVFPETEGSEIIHSEIIKNLETADLVLCDMSLLNPNVFFELGIRTALNKPVCMVTDEKTKQIPFDTNTINYHKYCSKLHPWKLENEISQLTKHISHTIDKRPDSNALWAIFGLKMLGKPFENKEENGISKFLAMENELLKSKLEKTTAENQLPSTVETHFAKYHRCSNCGYGFNLIDDNIKRTGIHLSAYSMTQLNLNHYDGIFNEEVVTCPKCGNVDKI